MQVKELLKKYYIKRLVKGIYEEIDEVAANGGNAYKVYIDWLFNDDWI